MRLFDIVIRKLRRYELPALSQKSLLVILCAYVKTREFFGLKLSPNIFNFDQFFMQEFREHFLCLKKLPVDFFQFVFGANKALMCGLWVQSAYNQESAERNMMDLIFQHAELQEGQEILMSGVGFGAFPIYVAKSLVHVKIYVLGLNRQEYEYLKLQIERESLDNIFFLEESKSDLYQLQKFDRVVLLERTLKDLQQSFPHLVMCLRPSSKIFTSFVDIKHSQSLSELQANYGENFFALKEIQQLKFNHYLKSLEEWYYKIRINRMNLKTTLEKVYLPANLILKRWELVFLTLIIFLKWQGDKRFQLYHCIFEWNHTDSLGVNNIKGNDAKVLSFWK